MGHLNEPNVPVAVSRESPIKRYAFNNADGPELVRFHQKMGMVLNMRKGYPYRPSRCSRLPETVNALLLV